MDSMQETACINTQRDSSIFTLGSDVIKTFFKTKIKTLISRPNLVFKTKTLHLKAKTFLWCKLEADWKEFFIFGCKWKCRRKWNSIYSRKRNEKGHSFAAEKWKRKSPDNISFFFFLGRLRKVDLIILEGEKCPSVRPQKVSSISVKFGIQVEVDVWCTTVCRMAGSKVKVTSPWKFEFLPFSKPISSAIYNGSWQMTTNS